MTVATEAGPHGVTARHVVESALAAYCTAVDSRDAGAVGALLAGAEVVFRGEPVTGDVTDFYEQAFASSGPPTRHVFSNLTIAMGSREDSDASTEEDVSYRATYQRWELGSDSPRCVALGSYHGTIRMHPAIATGSWTRHHVTTEYTGV